MLKSLTKTIIKYKVVTIIGGFLVVIMVGVFITSKVVYSNKIDVTVSVKPNLTLGPCFNNQKPPKTTIVTPNTNTKYTVGDKVALSGLAVLECDNSKIEDKNLAWYLDSDSSPFALGLTYSLENLKAGDHTIRLVALSGKLKGESSINVKFEEPKPQVLGTQTPPPAPPAAPVNQAPSVSILPTREGTVIEITEITENPFADITLDGSATDPEDGVLTGSNLQWLDNNNPIKEAIGTRLLRYRLTTKPCGTTIYNIGLKATDSKGLSSTTLMTITINHFNQQQCGGEAQDQESLVNLNLKLNLPL